jgi:predicted dinucleotide-binding enzyme
MSEVCTHLDEVVLRVSGDDADAKANIVALFQDAGFAPIDLGDLAKAARCSRSTNRSPAST